MTLIQKLNVENRAGRFLLVYREEYSGFSCLSVYRQRDDIEKAVRVLKTDMDIFPLRDRRESTRLNEKYSMGKMFLELGKPHMMEDQNGDLKEPERTKKQKDILNLLNSVSW